MATDVKDVVTWLKGWFYEKSEVYKKEETYSKTEVNNALSGKLNSNLVTANKNVVTNGSGDVVLEDKPVVPDVSGKIDTAGTGLSKSGTTLNHSNSVTAQSSAVFKKFSYDSEGHITGTSNVQGSDLPGHSHNATGVLDANAINYTNISPTLQVGENQQVINGAINTAIGNLKSIKAIEVVTTLPTASSSTMGKLYIVSENSKINVYYTEQNSSTYTWHKMDADILDELSISWNDITEKPNASSTTPSADTVNGSYGSGTDYARANHTHPKSSIYAEASHEHIPSEIDISDMGLYNFGSVYPVLIDNLEEYIEDREDLLIEINNRDVGQELATILTHIDTNYQLYQ